MGGKGGGSTSTTTIDYAYNDRMASIYEAMQDQSQDYFDFWESEYKPYEQAQIDANMSLLPAQTQYQLDSLDSASTLLPYQTESELASLKYSTAAAEDKLNQLSISQPIVEEYYKQALQGRDVAPEMNTAQADIQQQLSNVQNQSTRNAARMGLNINSGSFQKSLTNSIDSAKAISSARTHAKNTAKTDNFNRLSSAMQLRSS